MKYLKMLGLAAVAAMALMAVTAGSASATTLSIGGVTQSSSTTISASAESSITLANTEGSLSNTCSESSVHGTTTSTSGAKVTGPLSALSFTSCTYSPVTVETNGNGSLYIEHEAGTTSGSVFSEGAAVTVMTSLGVHVTCTTEAGGTKIGTLDGKASSSENATLTVGAVLKCGFLLPSASWKGAYTVTSPKGLGVEP